MKRLLCALVLLSATSACTYQRVIDSPGAKLTSNLTTSCERKMEAAMRAVDQFIGGGIVWNTEYEPEPSQAQMDTRMKIFAQWAEVKRECWK